MKCSWEREDRLREGLGIICLILLYVAIVVFVISIFVINLGWTATVALAVGGVFLLWLFRVFDFCERPRIEEDDGNEWDGARD